MFSMISSRKQFVRASGAAAIALAVSGKAAQSQSPPPAVAVRLASAPDEDVTPALYAQEKGLFRRAGLDVHITRSNSGAAVAAAVAGGAVDIGKSSLIALISARARGIPFHLIAPAGEYNTDAPVVGMIVRSDGAIRSARDLNGKTVSVPALKDLFAVATMGWIDAHGGDSSSVRFIELPASAVPQAIAEGRVDAASIANPILGEALDAGKVRLLGRSFDAIAPHFLFACWFCSADYSAKNRDTVDRFVRVIQEAAMYANAHHAEMVDIIARFTLLDPKIVARLTRTTHGVAIDPRQIQPLIDAAVKYKVIPASFDARDMVDAAALKPRTAS